MIKEEGEKQTTGDRARSDQGRCGAINLGEKRSLTVTRGQPAVEFRPYASPDGGYGAGSREAEGRGSHQHRCDRCQEQEALTAFSRTGWTVRDYGTYAGHAWTTGRDEPQVAD